MRFDTRRLAVPCAAICAFINLYATQALLPLFRTEFDASIGKVNLTVTATTLAVALLAPFAGLVSDLVGRKPPIVIAACLLTLPTLLIGFSDSLELVIACRLAQGLLIPFIFSATIAYIGEEWPAREAGEISALYITGTATGGFLGRFVPGVTAGIADWRLGFVALAALNALAAAVIWRWLQPSRRFRAAVSIAATLRGFGRHLANPRLLSAFCVGFCLLFTAVGSFTFVSYYLSAPPFGLGPDALGALFLVFLLALVVTPQAGRLANRVGRRRALAIGMSAAIVGIALTLIPVLPVILLGLALVSAGSFFGQAVATAYVSTTARDAKSSAAGLYVSAYYFGGSAAPIVLTPLWLAFGWMGCVAALLLVQLVPILLAALFWDELPRPPAPPEPAVRQNI